jgi:hypothetical protein
VFENDVRQTRRVTPIRPATDASAADWLRIPGSNWWDLVRYGPAGFEVYVRVTFGHVLDQDADPPVDMVRSALTTLVSCTTTPATAYAAIWDGWCGEPPPRAPRIEIPHRAMLLFTAEVEELRDAPEIVWHGTGDGGAEPNLVWPADRLWCLACEVDEEIEFTVGCSENAARTLESAFPGAVRRVSYGAEAPLFPDQTR